MGLCGAEHGQSVHYELVSFLLGLMVCADFVRGGHVPSYLYRIVAYHYDDEDIDLGTAEAHGFGI